MAQYEHRDANNEWHPFSHMENEKIERAYRANGCRVHLTMPLNPVGFREFEIRFGDSARSKKMPRPPSTKMIQVNVSSGATRVVRRVGPIDQPTMAPTLQYHGPATKKRSVVPIDQPTMGPTDAAPDWAAAKGAAPGGRVETENYCGPYTLMYSICFCCLLAPLFICWTFDAREVYIEPSSVHLNDGVPVTNKGKRYPGPVIQNWAPAY